MIKPELNQIELSPELLRFVDEDPIDFKMKSTYIKKQLSPQIEKDKLTDEDYQRIVEMAWQDRTHFDVIELQFGVNENELKNLMRRLISAKAYKRWRRRVQGRKTKHKKHCRHKPTRFEGPW